MINVPIEIIVTLKQETELKLPDQYTNQDIEAAFKDQIALPHRMGWKQMNVKWKLTN